MNRRTVMALVLVLGMVACGWLIIKPLTAQKTSAEVPAVSETPVATTVEKLDGTQPSEPRIISTPVEPAWREKLAGFQSDTNELRGTWSEEKMIELQNFAESVSLADLPNVLKTLHDLQTKTPTAIGQDLEMRLVRQWAEKDPRSAAIWTEKTSGVIHHEALGAVAATWARKSFADASAWAQGLSDGESRQGALKSIASEAVYSDPTGALQLIAQLPRDAERNVLIAQATGAWVAKSPDDAVAWAKQLNDDDLRREAISSVAVQWANDDPASAANLAARSLPSGKQQDDTVVAIVRRWNMKDTKAAALWIRQFPEGDLSKRVQDVLADDNRRLNSSLQGP